MKKYHWPALVFVWSIILIALFWKTIYLVVTTKPPPDYMVKNLEEQIKCARKIGIDIRRPIFRVMEKSPNGNEPNGLAHDIWPNGLIVLAPYASYQTMAHELGHITDYQTDRISNPMFEQIKDLSMENFANVVRDKIIIECQKPENRR